VTCSSEYSSKSSFSIKGKEFIEWLCDFWLLRNYIWTTELVLIWTVCIYDDFGKDDSNYLFTH
jgi:hypothetical protein